LRDLYIDQLRDLNDAEQQITQAMPRMIQASSSPDLRQTFQKHLDETKYQVERLDLIFKKLGETPRGKRCRGIEGIIAEGNEVMQAGGAPDVADAALIASAQRVEHYEIAGYGCVRTFADRLDDDYSADLLQKTLDEEEAADSSLTDLAEAGINQSAGAGKEIRGSRLTYVNAAQLTGENASFSDVKVRGAANEDLGRVDGFVVDRTSRRPYYVVVDSGGWFTGNRYLLPINSVQFNRGERQMKIAMDKDTIKRYPTFDGDAFEHTDERARDYETRLLEAYGRRTGEPAGTWSYERLEEFHQPDWWITEGVSVTPRPSARREVEGYPSASASAGRARSTGTPSRTDVNRPSGEGRSTIDEPRRSDRDRDRNR
jgi:ferritin-like metal-binding protein YciE